MIPVPEHVNGQAAAEAAANGELVSRVRQLRIGAQAADKPARGGSGWLPWALCGMLALAWASVGVKWSRAPSAAAPAAAGPAGAAAAAPPGAARTGSVAESGDVLLTQKGNLIPVLQIAVSPIDVSGRVTEIHFKEGDSVKKGFVLARLDAESYRRDYEEAEATLTATDQRLAGQMPASVRQIEKDQAEAEREDARATLVRAERDLDRLNRQQTTGTVAQQEFDKANADVRSGKARVIKADKALSQLLEGPRKELLVALDADVRAARARRDRARWRLDNCELKAPIDGIVLSKKADIGGLVNPLAFSSSTSGGGSSGSVCEVADLAHMEVELDVQERDIAKVRPNLDCEITADRDPARRYRGRVDRIMPLADDSKNVIKVRVEVLLPPGEAPGSFLVPKMSAVVTVFNREYKKS